MIEWLMERLSIEDSGKFGSFLTFSCCSPDDMVFFLFFFPVEAIHMANLLCQHGYFFPVGECNKNLSVKDDSSLYRFQVSTFSSPFYRIRRNPSCKIWNLPDWQYTLESLAAVFAVGIKLSIDWQTWRELLMSKPHPTTQLPYYLLTNRVFHPA